MHILLFAVPGNHGTIFVNADAIDSWSDAQAKGAGSCLEMRGGGQVLVDEDPREVVDKITGAGLTSLQ